MEEEKRLQAETNSSALKKLSMVLAVNHFLSTVLFKRGWILKEWVEYKYAKWEKYCYWYVRLFLIISLVEIVSNRNFQIKHAKHLLHSFWYFSFTHFTFNVFKLVFCLESYDAAAFTSTHVQIVKYFTRNDRNQKLSIFLALFYNRVAEETRRAVETSKLNYFFNKLFKTELKLISRLSLCRSEAKTVKPNAQNEIFLLPLNCECSTAENFLAFHDVKLCSPTLCKTIVSNILN